MAVYFVPGQGYVDDQQQDVPHYGEGYGTSWGVQGTREVPWYENAWQYNSDQGSRYQWEPGMAGTGEAPGGMHIAPGYVSQLLAWADAAEAGTLKPYEQEQWAQLQSQARAVPLRDLSGAYGGWGAQTDDPTAQRLLNVNSPDIGNFMLTVREKMQRGTATPQERALFQETARTAADWDYRASVPQASDAFNPLGDNLFGALGMLAMGASGGLAAAPLAAGGAGLATTLGSLGTLAGVAGTGAGVIGQATDQDWLSTLGLGLGIAGGLSGGLAGLSNLWSSGVHSLSDAARLAQSAGKVTGALGRIPGADPLKDVSRYLGYAGQAGQGLSGASDWLGWSGTNAPFAANVAPQSGVQNLLSAADQATQRGGGMANGDWLDFETDDWWRGGADVGASMTPDYFQSPAYQTFTGWGGDETQQGWYSNADLDTSGGGSGLWGTLGSLASGAGRLLFGGGGAGGGAGIGGPLLSALGSVGGGAIGSNAANEAARLQSQALNRGIDLQTAQWLQQQQNLAPYLAAGQGGLAQLQQLAGREAPPLQDPAAAIAGANYQMPSTTPGWTPQHIDAGAYRWTPGQGPSAQDYRYTPGNIPQAANYRYTPGAVPTLSGKELLANDPGVQFRMGEGRKALEASAAARGGLLSGPTLAALQRQGQELGSQEYGAAWNRASQQAQLREQWGQAASQMGWQQAEGEARLREQVNQIASQQGWSQAQAEATFREAMAQHASQQGFTQDLAGQQWNQKQAQSYETDLYTRMLEQNKYRYGQDVAQNQTDYDRAQALYRQRWAAHMLPWEQASTLANLGGQAVGQYGQQGQGATNAISNLLGQLGTTQGMGALGSAGQWNKALAGGVGGLQDLLRGLNT